MNTVGGTELIAAVNACSVHTMGGRAQTLFKIELNKAVEISAWNVVSC